ncbi:FosX/FosE/FosI family fosfomycin resistance thiol transferase [Microvirga sp. TS319]
MIEGLSHITLITSDLARISAIMSHVLDGQEIYSSGDETFSLSREKFFIVGGQWIAVMEGESLPSRSYNHIAFKIPATAIGDYRARIERLGLEHRTQKWNPLLGSIRCSLLRKSASFWRKTGATVSHDALELRESRPRVDGEGHSLYFYDHDNHLFELHTGTLDERLERYRRGIAA